MNKWHEIEEKGKHTVQQNGANRSNLPRDIRKKKGKIIVQW